MTLVSLAPLLPDLSSSHNSKGHQEVTLAFALDSGYLEPFKVMLTSMFVTGSFLESPITIYTDDEQVAHDPIVRLCADRVSLLSGKKRDVLYSLAKNSVKRPERSHWNKGTFLKWMIFEEQQTSALLFLDVDMVCLSNIEDISLSHPDSAFVCANQFKPSLRKDSNGKDLGKDGIKKNLINSIKYIMPEDMQQRINSGMMLIREPFLNNDFFDEITSFAHGHRLIHEQAHFSKYYSLHKSRFNFVSTKYNFQESSLNGLGWGDQYDVLKDVSILHYAGKIKPWMKKVDGIDVRASMLLWHQYRHAATALIDYR